jgi:ribonuclease P protein component
MRSAPCRPEPVLDAARGPESFGRDRRILRRPEYLETYAAGRRVAGRWLVFFVLRRDAAAARLGVTITKKTGSAVVRNRLRRRLKEVFRRTPGLAGGCDLVVNVRPGAEGASFPELRQDFEKLARKSGLLEAS